jgi:uncharacterized protein (TIGR03067 family)
MRRLLLAVGLTAGMAFAVAAADDDAQKALKGLEGKYKLTALEKGGMKAPPDVMANMEGVSIKGDVLVLKVRGEDKTVKLKVDPSKSPKEIDVMPQDGPTKGKTFLGIYSAEKGEVKILFAEEGARPKEFKTANDKEIMMTLRREEDKKEEKKEEKKDKK